MRVKRGFYCAVNGCASKPNGTISFFYFPRDQNRYLLIIIFVLSAHEIQTLFFLQQHF
jgi:hypothetical protein